MPDVTAKAFSEDHRGSIAPWPQAGQLRSFATMCGDAFAACRNPLAHNELPMDASQAFAWLGIAHLMMTLMDAPEDGPGRG